jgi:hypothetical protein
MKKLQAEAHLDVIWKSEELGALAALVQYEVLQRVQLKRTRLVESVLYHIYAIHDVIRTSAPT